MSEPEYGIDRAASPVSEFDEIVESETLAQPADKIGLCLSGGGYRAMLFHVGAICRLNEARLLPRLGRVSSVSGGSITAAVLGTHWRRLVFNDGQAANLSEQLIKPLRDLASRTIDRGGFSAACFCPARSVNGLPRHTISYCFTERRCRTCRPMRTVPGSSSMRPACKQGPWPRFSRRFIADYKVGMIRNPTVRLADAVAASSAFPPVLSPFTVKVTAADFAGSSQGPLHVKPFIEEARPFRRRRLRQLGGRVNLEAIQSGAGQ